MIGLRDHSALVKPKKRSFLCEVASLPAIKNSEHIVNFNRDNKKYKFINIYADFDCLIDNLLDKPQQRHTTIKGDRIFDAAALMQTLTFSNYPDEAVTAITIYNQNDSVSGIKPDVKRICVFKY